MQINISIELIIAILFIILSQSLFYTTLQVNSATQSFESRKKNTVQFRLSCLLLVMGWVLVDKSLVFDNKMLIVSFIICLSQLRIMYADKQFIEQNTELPQISIANSDMSVLLYIASLIFFAYNLRTSNILLNVALAIGLIFATLIFVRHQRIMGIIDGFSYIFITILWIILLANKS